MPSRKCSKRCRAKGHALDHVRYLSAWQVVTYGTGGQKIVPKAGAPVRLGATLTLSEAKRLLGPSCWNKLMEPGHVCPMRSVGLYLLAVSRHSSLTSG